MGCDVVRDRRGVVAFERLPGGTPMKPEPSGGCGTCRHGDVWDCGGSFAGFTFNGKPWKATDGIVYCRLYRDGMLPTDTCPDYAPRESLGARFDRADRLVREVMDPRKSGAKRAGRRET